METTIKTLILNPCADKWRIYKLKYHDFLKERDANYDKTMDFINDFYKEYEVFPTTENIVSELSASKEDSLLKWIAGVVDGTTQPIPDQNQFISHLQRTEQLILESDLIQRVTQFSIGISSLEKKNNQTMLEVADDLISELHGVKSKTLRTEGSKISLLYGQESVDRLENIYSNIKEKAMRGEDLFFDLGIKGLEEVKIKKGDYIPIGGYTSHGKSVLLRYIQYRFLVEYGMNCALFSFEMDRDVLEILFQVIHANNKKIFPGTPYISYSKFKNGLLTDEEADFLLRVAAPDFTNNESYGSLYIEVPSAQFTLSDLHHSVDVIESTIMELHCIGSDYLTLMNPKESGNGEPTRSDYNEMIKRAKSHALSHRDKNGHPSPYIFISPAQINRSGKDSAMANDNFYELSAIKEYSEIETSGDIILTCLLTPEMRQAKTWRIQNLKNRDGALVVDPVDIGFDFDTYIKTNIEAASEEEIVASLKELEI